MSDLIDLSAMLAEDPEPEPEPREAELRVLYDPDHPPRHYLGGARKGSGPWKARKACWRTYCAMLAHRGRMLESDYRVLNAVLTIMHRAGTDRLTVSILEIEAEAGTKHQTTWDAMNRILDDRWLLRIREGVQGEPKPGATGSGRSAEYRLINPPSSPTSRKPRKVHVSELDGRAEPSRDTAKDFPYTKVLKNHLPWVPGYPVSGREAEGGETTADSSGETTAKQGSETTAKPVGEWLRDRLARGPEMSRAVVAEGIEAGYSRPTLYRAAKALGVTFTVLPGMGDGNKRPPQRVTQWELP